MSSSATGSPNMEVKVVSQEMALLSNILAAYTFIAGTVPAISNLLLTINIDELSLILKEKLFIYQ